ncbi:OTU-like cysteine protease [Gracilaria domingensis]|nr:OTU-like cysteine protease [Gracilaria domingensis]
MWSTSSSPSPSPPRRRRTGSAGARGAVADARLQERTVIAAYRAHVSRSADALASRWTRFEAEPGDHALLIEIRKARAALLQAIEVYYGALGRRDAGDIERELSVMENSDRRLVNIEQEVLAEVQRFSSAAAAVNARFSAAANPAERLDVCADANDVLVELELYRDGWLGLMDEATNQRLIMASARLRNITNALPSSRAVSQPDTMPTPPNRSPRTRNSAPPPISRRSRNDPTFVVSRPGHVSVTPTQHLAVTSPDSTSSPKLLYPGPNPPPPPIANSRQSQRVEGDTAPLGMMISRSRTLRDMAENAMNTSRPDAADIEDATNQPSSTQQSAAMEQPSLNVSKNVSFASALYKTYNRRVDSISDAGLRLRRSEVRGDGRCLFRSLVRCRCHAKGLSLPSERDEKNEADMLRIRTVAELKKHRELLAKFFVIEGNFGRYTRRMSDPTAYGGEPELLMLAKLLHVPIAVYILRSGKYRQIQVYGKQYRGDPLRILYSDGIHYDALLTTR